MSCWLTPATPSRAAPSAPSPRGRYIVDIMNQVGYDLAVPGNHEFDYGMDNFLDLAENRAEYPYLCCQLHRSGGQSHPGRLHHRRGYGGVTVAYVGIDTPESFTKSTPTYFQDENGNYIYSFCQGNDGQDLYDAVQSAVDAATRRRRRLCGGRGPPGHRGLHRRVDVHRRDRQHHRHRRLHRRPLPRDL